VETQLQTINILYHITISAMAVPFCFLLGGIFLATAMGMGKPTLDVVWLHCFS
jgi:hypothetical protein